MSQVRVLPGALTTKHQSAPFAGIFAGRRDPALTWRPPRETPPAGFSGHFLGIWRQPICASPSRCPDSQSWALARASSSGPIRWGERGGSPRPRRRDPINPPTRAARRSDARLRACASHAWPVVSARHPGEGAVVSLPSRFERVADIAVRAPAVSAMFTRHTLAAYLGFHVNTVDRIVSRGEIPVYRIAGRRRFLPEDVDRYVREHRE